ncbi:glycosyltransferase family 2 protein [Vulcaniibacterium gelatinicum]|uniref:glycosyltransferase family 2 protein n=1 Tax=Vulcaniibacterium gelatinicum TaxID=2598725 RepID=UPI001FE74851|nr:glycosyltransferase family 2 protein [Vulcaniibacterium gelatinicum]
MLCTCNGARFLPAQLDSLLAQTRPPDEVVAVDDGSTDASFELLTAFRASAEARGIEVVLRRNPRNLGSLRNFESALRLAGGGLIFLCDQDDVWYPDKIARIEGVFRSRSELLLLHTDARLVDAQGAPLGRGLFQAIGLSPRELAQVHAGGGFEVLLRRSIVTGATAAFRRELLPAALPFPETWVHDEWLAMVAAIHDGLDTLAERWIDYRLHPGNQIGIRTRPLLGPLFSSADDARHVARRHHFRRVGEKLAALERFLATRADFPPSRRQALAAARRHARLRAAPPASWRHRAGAVLAELASGRYHRYSFGLRSAVADLLALE